MTETSQHIPHNLESARHLSPDPAPVLPQGLRGYLAENPDFGKKDGLYHPLFVFSTNPADALPPLPEELAARLSDD
jgi:hypothetical protein